MKLAILFFVAFFAISAVSAQSSRLESFDVDSLLKNDRILNSYIKCILDKGTCTSEGTELKSLLPDVSSLHNFYVAIIKFFFYSPTQTLKTNCAKCSANQKRKSRKIIDHLETKKPDQWKLIKAKFDPSGELTRKFKAST